jgi:hypothetical protein
MKTIEAYKAQAIGGGQIESVTLVLSVPIPEFKTVGFSNDTFDADADAIFDQVLSKLPGGTFDRLLVKMLERKVSSFAVPL